MMIKFQREDNNEFDFADKQQDFCVTKITGIDPPDTNINVHKTTLHYGGLYRSWSITDREITIEVFLLKSRNNDIGNNRQRFLDFFSDYDKEFRLFIAEHTIPSVFIDGFIKNIEYDVFNKPEKVSVTFVCPYPYFRENDIWGNLDEKYPLAAASIKTVAPRLYWKLGLGGMTSEYYGAYYYICDLGIERGCVLIAIFYADGSMTFDSTVSVTTITGKEGDIVIIDSRNGSRGVYLISNYTVSNGYQRMSGDFPRIPAHDTEMNYSFDGDCAELFFVFADEFAGL